VSGPAPPGPDPGRALAVRGPFRGVTGHDHHTPAQAALFAQLARLQPALGQAAPVLFTDRLLPGADMPGLYAAATHYWSMSHGEGWDQPMTEAAAAGTAGNQAAAPLSRGELAAGGSE
jgi:hypothetical protein